MKIKLTIILGLSTIFFLACTPSDPIYAPGVYTGVAEGYHSHMVVEVTTDEYVITEIEIVEEDETPILAEIVYDEIPKAVMKRGSTDVDVVAGATYTSETLLHAIEDSLEKARLPQNEER